MSEVQTLSPRSRTMLKFADKESDELGHRFVEPEHLLLALVKAEGIPSTAFEKLGIQVEQVQNYAQQARVEKRNMVGSTTQGASVRTRAVLKTAGEEAKTMGSDGIEPEHLLLGILGEASTRDNLTRSLNLDSDDLRAEVYLGLGLPLPARKNKSNTMPPNVIAFEEKPQRRFFPSLPTVKEVPHPLNHDLGLDKKIAQGGGMRSLMPVYIFLLLLLLLGFAFGLNRFIGISTFMGLGLLGLIFLAWYFGKRR